VDHGKQCASPSTPLYSISSPYFYSLSFPSSATANFSESTDCYDFPSAQRSNAAAQHFVANKWIGVLLCYIVAMLIYNTNLNRWNSLAFPMLSTSIFSSNGSIVYKQSTVFDLQFQHNQLETAFKLDIIGLPALTGSNAWSHLTSNLAIGGMIAHVVLFWGPYARDCFKLAYRKEQPDPHYQAMQKYEENPGGGILSYFVWHSLPV